MAASARFTVDPEGEPVDRIDGSMLPYWRGLPQGTCPEDDQVLATRTHLTRCPSCGSISASEADADIDEDDEKLQEPKKWKTFPEDVTNSELKHYYVDVLADIGLDKDLGSVIAEFCLFGIMIGDFIDVRDSKLRWCPARVSNIVLAKDETHYLKVQYVGWDSRWDEWVRFDKLSAAVCESPTVIAPLNTKSKDPESRWRTSHNDPFKREALLAQGGIGNGFSLDEVEYSLDCLGDRAQVGMIASFLKNRNVFMNFYSSSKRNVS